MAAPKTRSKPGVVTAALKPYVRAWEEIRGDIHRTKLQLTGLVVSTVDNGTAGHAGSLILYTLPKGMIRVLGGAAKFTSVVVDGTGITNVGAIEIGVGSTAAGTDMASLTGTTEDIITGTAMTLSTSVSALNRNQFNVTGLKVDNTAGTGGKVYVNVACSAATADSNGTCTLTGEIIIDWVNDGYAGE